MMVIDQLLSEADPAADLRADPESARAEEMLAGILATPRDAGRPALVPERPRGATRQVRRRRIAFGGAAVLAVTLAMSTLWSGGPNGTGTAYAVTARNDGSVELTVQWELLGNVDQLAARLRQAGVPTEVRSSMPARFCAGPADRDRSGDALNKWTADGEPASRDGYVMRPKLFPDGSILVIAVFSDPATQVTYTMLYLAPTGSTHCALNGPLGSARYTGPEPHPSVIRWPNPAEPE